MNLTMKPAEAAIRNYGLMAGTIPIIVITAGVLGTSLFVEPKKPEKKINPTVELPMRPEFNARLSRDISRHPSPRDIPSQQR